MKYPRLYHLTLHLLIARVKVKQMGMSAVSQVAAFSSLSFRLAKKITSFDRDNAGQKQTKV
jgi:hypothetical protein